MRERAGACDHAWELVVAAANAGDATALWRLAGDRMRRRRTVEDGLKAREARMVLRYGIDSDGHPSRPWDTDRQLHGAAPWWVDA
ncbi:hypothetical protein [Streptodolium elevatio]|uniref:Uncharacterized protein n=1 Tax=Streptodolium elevatio TaxID=3157996 RepID=A0ABV3DKP0_9ACTN